MQKIADNMMEITKEGNSYVFKTKVAKEMGDALKVFDNDKEIQDPNYDSLTENPFFKLFRNMTSEMKDTIRKEKAIPIDRSRLIMVDGDFYIK